MTEPKLIPLSPLLTGGQKVKFHEIFHDIEITIMRSKFSFSLHLL